MKATWRLLVDGRYYELTGCTTCTMRRKARTILQGRAGDVKVERWVDGKFEPVLTFFSPGGSRGGTTTVEGQGGEVRRVSSGVRPEGRDPQRSSYKLGRPWGADLSRVPQQTRQPWARKT